MFTRPFIDSLDFANRGGEVSGEVPVAELPRMADMLADSVGKISYVVRGLTGKDGKPQLELILDGVCSLRCQRCLNALPYPVKLVSRLRLVTEGEVDNADIEDDEVDSIPAEKRLDVLALLPIAPKHGLGACQVAVEGLNRSNNPFAVLAGLKK
jgi:uncharacterized protein